jgi:16S rRNA processing protein RimM
MAAEPFYQIGKVKKSFGNYGAVMLELDEAFDDLIEGLEHIFIPQEGANIPFFITEISYHHSPVLKLEEVDSPEVATKLANRPVFITGSQIPDDFEHAINTKRPLEGYMVYNGATFLGPLEEIMEYPSQLMASIKFGEKSILIPFVEEFIVKIDDRHKTLTMNLPDGLLDL